MYDVNSKHPDDFINHQEILETLAFAEENKHNEALITEIIEKAKKRKGLSHREAAVLLDCDIEEKNQEIYRLAEQIKKDFYGNRIVMFAPLYLSNYCINGCTYCPYHSKNKHIARKQLSTRDQKRGHRPPGHGPQAPGPGSGGGSGPQYHGLLPGQHQHHLQHQA